MSKGRLVTVQDIHNHPELSKRGISVNQYHDFDNDPLLQDDNLDEIEGDEKFESFSSPKDSGRKGYELWEKSDKEGKAKKAEFPEKAVVKEAAVKKSVVIKVAPQKAEAKKTAPKKGGKK